MRSWLVRIIEPQSSRRHAFASSSRAFAHRRINKSDYESGVTGSLHVEQLTAQGGPRDINMIVPIDLLPPILGDLLAYGRVNKPAWPWLGIYSAESGTEVVVAVFQRRSGTPPGRGATH